MVSDLDLVKKVQVEDFEHFTDLGFIDPEYVKKVGLVFGMVDARGEEWKVLKRLLTPAFSVPRIKKTAGGMNRCAVKLIQHLQESMKNGDVINLNDAVQKFAMSTIGAVAFGIDVDCFKDKNNDFVKHGSNLFGDVWRFMLFEFLPKVPIWTGMDLLNPKSKRFFRSLADKIIKQRKASTEESKDVLDILIKASNESSLMTPEMMFMTMVQFFGDGFDTYSKAFSGILYLLAIYPDVQEKLAEELETALEGKDDIMEEDMRNLPYMDQVINEGMRLMPFPFTKRICTKAYKIPGSDFTIPKDMFVLIPTVGLHHDPQYWPDPDTFDPDRFSPENKSNLHPGAFQPFGYGPRQCLGFNLMRIEAKVMLGHIVRNFRLIPSGNMSKKLIYDCESFMGIKGVENIKIEERK